MTEISGASSSRARGVALWALCAVPLVGAAELGLHVAQTRDVVSEADWQAARDAVKADFKPGDLVVFAPFWNDPNGRRWFGDELAPMKNEARPDLTRFARVFEVSIRGKHDDELAGFKKSSEKTLGRITLGVYENPSPAKVLADLVDLVGPSSSSVSLVTNGVEAPCTWQRGAGSPGGLSVPQGPAVPGDKWSCSGSAYVGVAVLHAIDHHPHLCIFATSPGAGATLRVKFANVTFGESLHGHDGVQWVTERTASGERITLAFSAFDRPIGQHVHKVGAGWVGFEFPTGEWAGKRGELVAEVSGGSGGGRHFCFEADTR